METVAARPFERHVLLETTILALICLVDTVWTVAAIGAGIAYEANPLLNSVLQHGFAAFIGVKLLSFLPALAIMEQLRNWRPAFIQGALRAGILGYLAVYVIGTLQLHGGVPGF